MMRELVGRYGVPAEDGGSQGKGGWCCADRMACEAWKDEDRQKGWIGRRGGEADTMEE